MRQKIELAERGRVVVVVVVGEEVLKAKREKSAFERKR